MGVADRRNPVQGHGPTCGSLLRRSSKDFSSHSNHLSGTLASANGRYCFMHYAV